MSLKVFVSYSAKDEEAMRLIKRELSRIPDVEVFIDKDMIPAGSNFRHRISDMINAADLVVANLTPAALESREVVEELTRAHERGRKIVALVAGEELSNHLPWFLDPNSAQHIFYTPGKFDGAVAKLKGTLGAWSRENGRFIEYCWLLLSGKPLGRNFFFACLVLANLGFAAWYFVNTIFHLPFFSIGHPMLVEWCNAMHGPFPAIWAVTANGSVVLAVLLAYNARMGVLRRSLSDFLWSFTVAMVIFAIAASLFYLSPIDELLRTHVPHTRLRELLSTFSWSLCLSVVPALLFPFAPSTRRAFWTRHLRWMPAITVSFSLLFLLAYMALCPANTPAMRDTYRGLFAGVGLRTGLFISLYVAALASASAPMMRQRS